MRKQPNNKFHVRIYTDDGAKIEIFSDPKQPQTLAQILDGLENALSLVRKVMGAEKGKVTGG